MYLDTAIIIKLLTVEPDSEFFQDAVAGELLATSELAHTEVWSALLAKERSRAISPAERTAAWRVFNERIQLRQITLYPLHEVVLKKANTILERCHPGIPLRTPEAIHTASCDLAQEFPLCTKDKRMRDAALAIGIPVFPAPEAFASLS